MDIFWSYTIIRHKTTRKPPSQSDCFGSFGILALNNFGPAVEQSDWLILVTGPLN